jgi:predicted amino acid racemase
MYPALVIDREKLVNNIKKMQQLCGRHGIDPVFVTKVYCANEDIVNILYDNGVRRFADSRIENLRRVHFRDVEKWLLRIPMQSEADLVVKYADVSLNSELSTMEMLSEAAIEQGKKHKVILMVDLGDLREGVLEADAVNTALEIMKLEGLVLHGIGVNFNCYGGIIPSDCNMGILARLAGEVEKACGIKLSVVSGGNSGSLHMLTTGKMPAPVNNLRIGETVLFGGETSYSKILPGFMTDVFTLEAEIIELKTKPSLPVGESGPNAFGDKVCYEDKGDMLRAIIACGKQDVTYSQISPMDTRLEILGSSSDHMIIDATKAKDDYKVGGIMRFSISYGALLSLSNSEYVKKTVR